MDKKADFMANLMRGKQLMGTTDNYKVDHKTVHQSMQANGDQLLESIPNGATPQRDVTKPMGNASVETIKNSRLPDAVKKLMIEQPIPKLEMGSGGGPTFSLADVKGLVQPQMAQTQIPTQQVVNEQKFVSPGVAPQITNSAGQMLITLTEAELDKKINDALLNFMATTFTKNLTENTIKRTITTLIKEGKIKVKQKTTK
jgi:hypothetical protein